ncbi:MAG: hypothetical protein MN733_08850 [Nitrososphaera sp.]|nr:hypothetical protein [Nitrososphaera sp.]
MLKAIKFYLIGALLIPGMAEAAPVYTPAELRSMVNSGNPPQQGKPSSQSQTMDYGLCAMTVGFAVEAVSPDYPTQTLHDTDTAIMEKVWTNDAAVILTCAYGKLITTICPYL